jgi:hydrogenase nickel incorporation protein HypA/HybF
MHELSIAMSVLDVASEEAERRGVEVVAIRLRIGPLAGVVREALESAYEVAREGSAMPNARLVIEETPLVAYCRECKIERRIASPQMICCPVCGVPTPDIVSGRELEVVALEVIDVPANTIG